MSGYPKVTVHGHGTQRFRSLLSEALTAAAAHALAHPLALAAFELTFDELRALGVYGNETDAYRDLLREGERIAARWVAGEHQSEVA